MSVLTRPALAAIVAASTVAASASSALVAGWTITTAFPTGTGNVPTGVTYSVGAADQGAQTAGSSLTSVHALAAATYTSPSGNGSQYGFSSNNWSPGDFYEATFSTAGYTDINLSWDQTRSSTGPSAFKLFMSIDGGANFTELFAYTVLQSGGAGAPGTWNTTTYNAIYNNVVNLGVSAENQGTVIVRFQNAEAVVSAAAGSSRIDNVMVYSGPVPAPGAIALLGLAGLAGRRRR